MDKVQPIEGDAIGVLNPYGQLWSWQTFRSVAEAEAYVERFWEGVEGRDLSGYRYIPVRVSVVALNTHSGEPG